MAGSRFQIKTTIVEEDKGTVVLRWIVNQSTLIDNFDVTCSIIEAPVKARYITVYLNVEVKVLAHLGARFEDQIRAVVARDKDIVQLILV